MTNAIDAEVQVYIASLPKETREFYAKIVGSNSHIFANDSEYSDEVIKERVEIVNDIKMRIEMGYSAWKDLREIEY